MGGIVSNPLNSYELSGNKQLDGEEKSGVFSVPFLVKLRLSWVKFLLDVSETLWELSHDTQI